MFLNVIISRRDHRFVLWIVRSLFLFVCCFFNFFNLVCRANRATAPSTKGWSAFQLKSDSVFGAKFIVLIIIDIPNSGYLLLRSDCPKFYCCYTPIRLTFFKKKIWEKKRIMIFLLACFFYLWKLSMSYVDVESMAQKRLLDWYY